jgi:hypothetical protein
VLQAPVARRTGDANAHVVLGTSLLGVGHAEEAVRILNSQCRPTRPSWVANSA